MDNVKNTISGHNKKIINSGNDASDKTWICRNKSKWPLDNKCLINEVVYKAEIETYNDTNELSTKVYLRIRETECIRETEFKSRYNNHTISFRNWTHENDTKLSKYIWSLKDENKDFNIIWSILKKSSGYSIISKLCNHCLLEKLLIFNFKEKDRLLNKWFDLASKCQHENKYMLINYSGIG